MQLEIGSVSYHIEIVNKDKEKTLVFLHGFTGSIETWREVAGNLDDYKLVFIDLLGHGETGSPLDPVRYSMEKQVQDLELLFEKLELHCFTLIGYSMGGRTALSYAYNYPERLKSLVLESASPGLKTEEQRLERRKRDEQLAKRILRDGIESFVVNWENIPLFESQKTLPEEVKDFVRAERLAQDPRGLANSLIGMGTGSQVSYWEVLEQMTMPVLLVTGQLDSKFSAIAEEMYEVLPKVQWKSIEAGHAIHVEKPAEFATIVDEYLKMNF